MLMKIDYISREREFYSNGSGHMTKMATMSLHGRKPVQSKKDNNDQESIQSSTTSVPGYQRGK